MNLYKTPGIISVVIEPRNLQSLAEEKFKNAKPTIKNASPKTQQRKKNNLKHDSQESEWEKNKGKEETSFKPSLRLRTQNSKNTWQ